MPLCHRRATPFSTAKWYKREIDARAVELPGEAFEIGPKYVVCREVEHHVPARLKLGRSPMQHVIYLRMRHAAKLLATTEDKVETIAREIGYENPFVFSTTFKRWVGWSPSDYRARARR